MAYISTCRRNIICLFGIERKQISNIVYDVVKTPSTSFSIDNLIRKPRLVYASSHSTFSNSCSLDNASSSFRRKCHVYRSCKQNTTVSYSYRKRTRINFSTGYRILNSRVLDLVLDNSSKVKYTIWPFSWEQQKRFAGFCIAVVLCCSTSQSAYAEAEAPKENLKKKNVFNDYSVIGIPGDGRCLFRAVSHGACVRSGKDPPSETLQREMADDLRALVADEFVRRREETEWFIEGDFDTYISKIRKPHEWGGEPELLMASHVLRMPITVYMHDKDSGGLRAIAEYGQEYSKENPIQVLYHGSGHYDALLIFDNEGARSRL